MKKLLLSIVILCMIISFSNAVYAATSTVTYGGDAWQGTASIYDLGLDNTYSYGVYYGTIPTEYQYTVENKNDGISITSTSAGGFEKGSYVGITKSIDTTNMIGNKLIIKTGFYSDGTNKATKAGGIGYGTGIRLKNSTNNTASFSMLVGKLGNSTTGCGLDMRADNNVKNGDFGSSGMVLRRGAGTNSGSVLETNTWYDLTITVDKSKETDNITVKLGWDIPSNYTDENYSASFKVVEGLTVSGGRATLTNTYTTAQTDINAIELLQAAPDADYIPSTSKFKDVSIELTSLDLSNVTDKSGNTVKKGSTIEPTAEELNFAFTEDVNIENANFSIYKGNGTTPVKTDSFVRVDTKTVKAELGELESGREYTLKLFGIKDLSGISKDFEFNFATSGTVVVPEQIILNQEFEKNEENFESDEITTDNVATNLGLGAGFSVYSSGSDNEDGKISFNPGVSETGTGAIDILFSEPGTKRYLGVAYETEDVVSGRVTVDVATRVRFSSNPQMGIFQYADILDEKGNTIAKAYYNDGYQIKLKVGSNAEETVVALRNNQDAYYNMKFVLDTNNNELDFILTLRDYAGSTLTKGDKFTQETVESGYKFSATFPISETTGLKTVRLYSYNSGGSARGASFDKLLIHNYNYENHVEFSENNSGNEIVGDGKISVLSSKIAFELKNNDYITDITNAKATLNGEELKIVKESNKIEISLPKLEMNTDYELIISGIYDAFGDEFSITKNIKTGGNPIAATLNAPIKTETGVTYNFSIDNEYPTSKTITAFIVQYSSDGMIKAIKEKNISVAQNSNNNSDTLSLDYSDDTANGDIVRLILIDSLDFVNGLHPIMKLTEEHSSFDIIK